MPLTDLNGLSWQQINRNVKHSNSIINRVAINSDIYLTRNPGFNECVFHVAHKTFTKTDGILIEKETIIP